MCPDAVGVIRDHKREDLFSRPERFRFKYGRLGHLAVPGWNPHQ